MLDLCKAFDCVSHDLLLNKLHYYGIHGIVLDMFRSYLTGRKQCASVNGKLSGFLDVNFGVPQGSILGTFLFIIMVNDIVYNIPPTVPVLYADDTSFLTLHQDLEVLNVQCNCIIEAAETWFASNEFIVNTEKTQEFKFSLGTVDNTFSSVKLLGFNLDQKLFWNEHISSVCNRLSRVLYVLHRLVDCVSYDIIMNVYFGLFHCHLLNGVHLWNHSAYAAKIFILQKKLYVLLVINHVLNIA